MSTSYQGGGNALSPGSQMPVKSQPGKEALLG